MDWRLRQAGAASVNSVALVSEPGEDNTYGLDDVIRVRVTFSEAVDVTGNPQLTIDLDPAHWGEKWAFYEGGSGTAELTFAYTVAEQNESTQGIAVLTDTLALNGGTIRSTANGIGADLSHTGLDHDANHKVDWQANSPATGAPTITGTAQVGETLTADTSGISDDDGLTNATFSYQWLADDADISGATGSTYTLADADEGKAVKVRVSFTDDGGNEETLTSAATAAVSGQPPEPLTVTLENAPASHDGSGSFTFDLRFSEEVKLSYQSLRDHAFTVTGGTVRKAQRLDEQSNIRWQVTVQPDSNADVTAVLPVTTDCEAQGAICTKDGARPLSNSISVTVVGPVDNSPAIGAPTITGTAQVGETLTADTSGISDDDGLTNATFSYQWLADDADISGATGSTYTLADADEGKAVKVRVSFTDDGGNEERLVSVSTTAVAGATPQEVTGVAVVSDPGDDDTYGLDDVIRVRVTFSEAVDVNTTDGTPRLKIDMDPAHWGEKWAVYESGSGTTELIFAYTVVEPNTSTQGIAVLADTLELNGGTIRSTASDTGADLAHDGLSHDPEHKVNWEG